MHKTSLVLAATLLLAAVLRLYQLGQAPAGMTWDEAAIGYNGYSVLTTRRDEWLERLPVSFRSFGDYKAPLAIYINGFFTAPLGFELWAVRLPFALSGIVAVGVWFWVVSLFFDLVEWGRDRHPRAKLAAVGWAAALLATSPWHLQYTRAGFESGLSLTFVLAMVGFFISAFVWGGSRQQTASIQATSAYANRRTQLKLLTAALMGSLSMYAYHSAKLVAPLLAISLLALMFVIRRKQVWALFWQLVVAAGAALALLYPLIHDALFGHGLERAGVSVFAQEQEFGASMLQALEQFFVHLMPSFLLFGQTTTLRHGTGVWGVLFATTAFLVVVGFVYIFVKRTPADRGTTPRTLAAFFILWIAIGILPAAIATEVPHSNRSLLALPGFLGLASVGVWVVYTQANALRARLILGTLACLHILLFVAYSNYYFGEYQAQSADEFNHGYLEALQVASQYASGVGKPKVSKVVLSSAYGQSYIYALFASGMSPIEYQGGLLSQRYLFVDEVSHSDLERTGGVLLVASKHSELLSGPRALDADKFDYLFYDYSGEVRFGLIHLP